MSHAIATVLVIGLAISLGFTAFIGFQTGVLRVVPPADLYSINNYLNPQSYNDSMGSGALQYNVALSGQPFITGLTFNQASTTMTITVGITSNGNCGNGGDPASDPGSDSWSYFGISLINGPNKDSGNAPLGSGSDGNAYQYWTGTYQAGATGSQVAFAGTHLFVSFNNTFGSLHTWINWCYYVPGLGGGNAQSTNFVNTPIFVPITVAFTSVGVQPTIMPNTIVRVDFFTIGTYCSGSSGNPVNICADADAASNAIHGSNTGDYHFDSYAEAVFYQGSASLSIQGNQIVYNGGTLSVAVSTGYAGVKGYTLEVDCPSVRPCAGQPDSTFANNPQSVANLFGSTATVSFQIPGNASQANSNPRWNIWYVVLKSPYLAEQTAPFGIDISKAYTPNQPTASISFSSGGTSPKIGDTATITLTGSGTSTPPQTISSFILWAYYELNGNSATNLPSCASGLWITSGCSTGMTLNASAVLGQNNTYQATYTFKVTQYYAIGLQFASVTNLGQVSAFTAYAYSVVPSGCQPGMSCYPPPPPGPINLTPYEEMTIAIFAAIAIATALIFLYVVRGPGRQPLVLIVTFGAEFVAFVFLLIPLSTFIGTGVW